VDIDFFPKYLVNFRKLLIYSKQTRARAAATGMTDMRHMKIWTVIANSEEKERLMVVFFRGKT
jgi:hypothetical protein